MNDKQELESTVRELELARANLKGVGSDAASAKRRQQLESKLHWLEGKVDKLRRKQES